MQPQKVTMGKRQFRIGDLAKELHVKKFVIRFWEREFDLKSDRSQGGQRFYTDDDLKTFQTIKHLLYEQGFTIAGAKKHLQPALNGEIIAPPATPFVMPLEAVHADESNEEDESANKVRPSTELRTGMVRDDVPQPVRGEEQALRASRIHERGEHLLTTNGLISQDCYGNEDLEIASTDFMPCTHDVQIVQEEQAEAAQADASSIVPATTMYEHSEINDQKIDDHISEEIIQARVHEEVLQKIAPIKEKLLQLKAMLD